MRLDRSCWGNQLATTFQPLHLHFISRVDATLLRRLEHVYRLVNARALFDLINYEDNMHR